MGVSDVSLERRLADLGWNGVPLPTVMAEMLWLFVTAGLDCSAVLRRLDGVIGEDGDGMEDCRRAIGALLDEAHGQIGLLRRPGSREPLEVLDALARLRGDDGE